MISTIKLVLAVIFYVLVISTSLVLSARHPLKCLILLEGLVLSVAVSLCSLISFNSGSPSSLVVVLTFSVLSASLGLALLSNLCRSVGSSEFMQQSSTW